METEFLIIKSDPNNYPLYHFGRDYHKLSYLSFKNSDYKNHLRFSILSAWYYLSNNYAFIPGGLDLLNEFYSFQNPLQYTGATFLNKSFSKQNLIIADVNKILDQYFNSFKNDVYAFLDYGELSELSNKRYRQHLFEITNKFDIEYLLSLIYMNKK